MSDDVRGFYVLLRNSFKRKKNEVIVLSLIIRLFTCVILLGVAVCKAVRCGSKRVNAAPLLMPEEKFLGAKFLGAKFLGAKLGAVESLKAIARDLLYELVRPIRVCSLS